MTEATPDQVTQLAAILRAQGADLPAMFNVLATTLPQTLPPGWVTIASDRSVADRVSGRAGRPQAIRVRIGDQQLDLRLESGRLQAEARHIVRGVVLSSTGITVAQWVQELARAIWVQAGNDESANRAMRTLLGLPPNTST
jgi:hypothetical protein